MARPSTTLPILIICVVLATTTALAFQNALAPKPTTRQSSTLLFATTEQKNSRRDFLSSAGAVGLLSSVLVGTRASPARAVDVGGKIVYGDESIMAPKAHGTSEAPVQSDLLYGVSNKLADRITNYNRHFAEIGGYFESTDLEKVVLEAKEPVTFYDSVTGKPLFVAPLGRSAEDFIEESRIHGWPSFRDTEVVWQNVRVLRKSGETVSVDGTHLGHNLPDRKGNRYCINLVSVAGRPTNTAA